MNTDVNTFDDDLFELREFAKRLESFIEVERDYVTGGLVIGLNAPFGSGKSTFLRMWRNDIKGDKENTKRPLVIDLNAWESDYYGDPLFGIISGLAHSGDEKKTTARTKLIEAAKDVGWFMVGVGGQIASAATGVNPIDAGEFAEKKKDARNKGPNKLDSFTLYEDRMMAMKTLQGALHQFVLESGRVVLFLVDELDRCRPDYAISYLETIKHIFDIPGTVFLLAADRHQLKNSAMMAFGQELNFDEYYRKFVHREVQLPDISEGNYYSMAQRYVRHYLEVEGRRHCFFNLNTDNVSLIAKLSAAQKLTPRQIQEVFRLLGHTLDTSKEKQGRILWALGYGTVLMAALKVGAPDIYRSLGTQNIDPLHAYTYFTELVEKNVADWWFDLVVSGGGFKLNETETLDSIYKKAGLPQPDLSSHRQGWNFRENEIPRIYSTIETVSKWK